VRAADGNCIRLFARDLLDLAGMPRRLLELQLTVLVSSARPALCSSATNSRRATGCAT
jgi:hypothetical protein